MVLIITKNVYYRINNRIHAFLSLLSFNRRIFFPLGNDFSSYLNVNRTSGACPGSLIELTVQAQLKSGRNCAEA